MEGVDKGFWLRSSEHKRVSSFLRPSKKRKLTRKKPPRGYGYGHIGARPDVRSYEDRHFVGTLTTPLGELTVAIVADGVGGSGFGERAAELAIQSVIQALQRTQQPNIIRALGEAIGFANKQVYQAARRFRDPSRRDMGTTLAIAVIHNGRLYIANVGDSRIYLLRGNELRQLTVDHVWAMERHRYQGLPLQEAWKHPNAHMVMRSLGREPKIAVDLGLYWNGLQDHGPKALQNQGLLLQDDDVLLLCSDGLIKNRPGTRAPLLTSKEIVEVLHAGTAEQSAKMLVDIAVSRGADDNVTAVVVEMPGHKPRRVLWQQLSPRTIIAAILAFFVGLGLLAFAFRNDILVLLETQIAPPPPDHFRVVRSEQGWRGIGPQSPLEPGNRFVRVDERSVGVDLYTEPQGSILLQFRPDRYVEIGADTQVRVGMDETWPFNGYALAQEFRQMVEQEPNTFYQPLLLTQGALIVSTGRDPGKFSVFIDENGYRFDALGTIMGVCLRENVGLRVDCFEGTCRWSSPTGETQNIPPGRAWVWEPGTPTWREEPADFALTCYRVRGYLRERTGLAMPTPTSTPTPTPTFTPTPTPTSTPVVIKPTERRPAPGDDRDGDGPLPAQPTPTPTFIPTLAMSTPSPSETPSPTPGPLPSPTSTPSPSETPSPTPGPLPSPTPTPPPAETPSPTPGPLPSPTPEPPPTEPPPPTPTPEPPPTEPPPPTPTPEPPPTEPPPPTPTPEPNPFLMKEGVLAF